jgi:hypothetical protein
MPTKPSDILRMKTTLQELVTAVENLVSWAEQQAVTKQDLHEALGPAEHHLQGQLEDEGKFPSDEELVVELLLDGGLRELGTDVIGCLFSEIHREADLRGLLDAAGQLRCAPPLASLLLFRYATDPSPADSPRA